MRYGNCGRHYRALKNVLRARNYLNGLFSYVYLTDLQVIAVFVGSDLFDPCYDNVFDIRAEFFIAFDL